MILSVSEIGSAPEIRGLSVGRTDTVSVRYAHWPLCQSTLENILTTGVFEIYGLLCLGKYKDLLRFYITVI